jgi:hypothetical protein
MVANRVQNVARTANQSLNDHHPLDSSQFRPTGVHQLDRVDKLRLPFDWNKIGD